MEFLSTHTRAMCRLREHIEKRPCVGVDSICIHFIMHDFSRTVLAFKRWVKPWVYFNCQSWIAASLHHREITHCSLMPRNNPLNRMLQYMTYTEDISYFSLYFSFASLYPMNNLLSNPVHLIFTQSFLLPRTQARPLSCSQDCQFSVSMLGIKSYWGAAFERRTWLL